MGESLDLVNPNPSSTPHSLRPSTKARTSMTTKKTNTEKSSANSVIAKSDDGTIQITFTIPYTDINEAQEGVAKEMGKDIEVPGFRKGMAPTSKVIDHVSKQTLLEKTLSKILPKLVAGAINEHKITPALYPKFELVKAVQGEDRQIRAVTCELPKIELSFPDTALIYIINFINICWISISIIIIYCLFPILPFSYPSAGSFYIFLSFFV